jgi:hypothetical protein
LHAECLLTATNVQPFCALYAPMEELMADGKSRYKTTNKVKLQDYTLRKVLQQVRREQGDGSGGTKEV